jgi:hypothetical protein
MVVESDDTVHGRTKRSEFAIVLPSSRKTREDMDKRSPRVYSSPENGIETITMKC